MALTLLFSAFFTLPSFAVVLKPTDANPKVLAEITDKNGKVYQFREINEMTPAVNAYTYDFGTAKDGYKNIYSGQTYTDSENCPHSDYAKKYTIADKALLKHSFFKRDFNFDGVDDINLSLALEDCKTGKIFFIEKLILSNGDKFEVKQYTLEK